MCHLAAVQSNTGLESTKLGYAGHDLPVFPKPRRLGSAIPDFLKSLRCSKHSQLNPDGRGGILNMIAEKTTEGQQRDEKLYALDARQHVTQDLLRVEQIIHSFIRWSSFRH